MNKSHLLINEQALQVLPSLAIVLGEVGEWFRLTQEDADYICSILDGQL